MSYPIFNTEGVFFSVDGGGFLRAVHVTVVDMIIF